MKLWWLLLLMLVPSVAFGISKPEWSEVKHEESYTIFVDAHSIKPSKPFLNFTVTFTSKHHFDDNIFIKTKWLAACNEDTLVLKMVSSGNYKNGKAKEVHTYRKPRNIDVKVGSDEEALYDFVCSKVLDISLSSN